MMRSICNASSAHATRPAWILSVLIDRRETGKCEKENVTLIVKGVRLGVKVRAQPNAKDNESCSCNHFLMNVNHLKQLTHQGPRKREVEQHKVNS